MAAEEALLLAAKLRAWASSLQANGLTAARSDRARQDAAVGTEVRCHHLSDWERAAALLPAAHARLQHIRGELLSARARAEEAQRSRRAAEQEVQTAAAALAAVGPSPAPPSQRARRAQEAELKRRLAKVEAGTLAVRNREKAEAASFDKQEAALRKELADATARTRRAEEQLAELGKDDSVAQARAALEREEAEAKALEEERNRLQEEADGLRVALKTRKNYNHKRIQDLAAQVQKLERQHRKLKDEQEQAGREAQRAQEQATAEAAAVQQKLANVQQLNDVLSAQVFKAREERDAMNIYGEKLREQRDYLRRAVLEKDREVQSQNLDLDRLSDAVGELRREAKRLSDRAAVIEAQIRRLGTAAGQRQEELREAEAARDQLREEVAASERRAKLLEWKSEVAENQLGRPARPRSKAAQSPDASPSGNPQALDGANLCLPLN